MATELDRVEQAVLALCPGVQHIVTDDWLVRGRAGSINQSATRQRLRDFQAGAWLPGLGPGSHPEPVPTERLRVRFSGPGAGRAPLTWGQRDIWATMRRQHNWLPQGGRRPLAPGTRPEDVAAELTYLHSRYPAMRTRLSFDNPDGETLGEASQWLVSSGETHLDLYDAPTNQNPDTFAARIEAAYRRRPYDLRHEWPVRMAVVRTNGACTHLVVLMHHLALDAGGAAVMLREVAARIETEPYGMQPLEQAAWQASEAGRRHNDKTLRHFAHLLGLPTGTTEDLDGTTGAELGASAGTARAAAVADATRAAAVMNTADPAAFVGTARAAAAAVVTNPANRPPTHPRHWSARLTSPDLAASAAAISTRTGIDDASVLTALIAIAFARLTADPRVVIRPRVGNRFRPSLTDVVCFVAQSGLLVLDLAETTFDGAITRARRASMAAMKHAYFDPEALDALLSRSTSDASRHVSEANSHAMSDATGHATPAMFFNDRRAATPTVAYTTEAAPDPREPPTTRGRSTFAWLHRGPEPTEPLSVTLDNADSDDIAALSLSVHFDTHVISPQAVEEFAWGVEQAASEALHDGSRQTGL